mgnify:CR=1 FL=1
MGCILIAMPKYEDANRISDMIRRSGEAIETRPCQNGNEVLRTLSNQDVSAVICTKQLKDMGYEELSTYLPNNVYMILLTKDSGFVPFSSNIISLVMPFKTEDLLVTIRKVVPEVFERPNKKETEESLLRMVKEKEETDKHLLRIEVIFGIMISILCIGIIMFGALYPGLEGWLRIVLCVISAVILFAFCFVGIGIEQKAGYYVCPNCGHRYIPTYKSVLFSVHINRTRHMKCPNCGKKGWHKKTVRK